MIKDNLYETKRSPTDYLSETDVIQSIPIETVDFAPAYYCGWVRQENLPSDLRLTKVENYSGGFKFVNAMAEANFPVGYTTNYQTGRFSENSADLYVYNGKQYVQRAMDSSYTTPRRRLPNKLSINNIGTVGTVRLGFVLYGTYESGGSTYSAGISTQWVSYTVEVLEFLKENNGVITLNFPGMSTGGEVFSIPTSLRSSFFKGNKAYTMEFLHNGSNVKCTIWLFSIDMPDGSLQDNSSTVGYSNVRPFVALSTDEGDSCAITTNNSFHSTYFTGSQSSVWRSLEPIRFSQTTFEPKGNTGRLSSSVFVGGLEGTVPMEAVSSSSSYQDAAEHFYIYNNSILTDYEVWIFPFLSIEDAILHAALCPKLTKEGLTLDQIPEGKRSVSEYFYYPEVLSSGEFTGKFKTNVTEKNKEIELQEWQYSDDIVGSNTVSSDSIPPYVAPPYQDPNRYVDSTPLNTPVVTSLDMGNTGYVLTKTEAIRLVNALSSVTPEQIDQIKNKSALWSDPLQSILSLRFYPFRVANYADHSEAPDPRTIVTLGDITLKGKIEGDTNPDSVRAKGLYTNQIVLMGSYYMKRIYNNFRDFEPYTKASLTIPFFGTRPLNLSEWYGHVLSAEMVVDFMTGTAKLFVFKDGIIEITDTGNVGMEIPLNSVDMTSYAQNSRQAAYQIAGNIINDAASVVSAGVALASGNPVGFAGAAFSVINNVIDTQKTIGDQRYNVNKVNLQRIGSSTSEGEYYSPMTPYLSIYTTEIIVPTDFSHTNGKACFMTRRLGALKGYTECGNTDVSGIEATNEEKVMIQKMLSSGVYL